MALINPMGNPSVKIMEQLAQKRVNRRPRHPFGVVAGPYEICPFYIAPVQAGETLTRMFYQSRAASSALGSRLAGSHLEHYFFYVKLSDLDDFATIRTMLMDPTANIDALKTSAIDTNYYEFDDAVPWCKMCVKRVVDKWFRDEGEVDTDHVATSGYAYAKVQAPGWMSSVIDALDSDDELFDIDLDIDADSTITVSEMQQALSYWTYLSSRGITEQTWPEYLKTFGVSNRLAIQQERLPELIRTTREWAYPANTIDPTDGSATSAASFAIRERADKDRFFSEPGFLVGVTIWRPKIHFSELMGSACGLMDNALTWLPAALQMHGDSGMVLVDKSTAGPVHGGPWNDNADDYRVDIRDIFLYGDQFRNNLAATDLPSITMPDADGEKQYPVTSKFQALAFGGATDPVMVQDGVVETTIKTRIEDLIPAMHSDPA